MTADGYDVLAQKRIPEIDSLATLYRHRQTGAELLSLENNDPNKSFGITFRTPPADSTGIAHILEHSVLSGSKKYPVKEPFIELVKSSLKTFLNAFTSPDKTTYPCASQNLQDFYNLVDVYLDAVLNPLIPPQVLEQQGWHYELQTVDEPLRFKGVVFNEMKGAYANPQSLLGRKTQQVLFPDTPYSFDSGGDPAEIPDLTYEQFKSFHRRYYHPSNARLYFYGDDPPERRLVLASSYLDPFDAQPVDSSIPGQPSFSAPQKHVFHYAADPETSSDAKGFLTLNWVLAEVGDPELTLSLRVLEHVLLGTPGSPLRKALIDSGLGEDLAGGGFSTGLRQMTFSTGLKGVALETSGQIEPLILETLTNLAEHGFDPLAIEAAVNTLEFRLREQNTGSFPRGLAIMLAALTTWLHDGDPFTPLAFEEPLARLKGQLEAGEPVLQGLLRGWFLENNHRATVEMLPDPELGARQEAEEGQRLAAVQAALSPQDLSELVEKNARLKRRQQTPDPPEALETLPTLSLGDLEREARRIPCEEETVAETRTLYHDLFTNGIVYLDLTFDLNGLPQRLLPYVRLFGRALLEMGTKREDYVRVAQRIGRDTGGVWPGTLIAATHDGAVPVARMTLRAKATPEKAGAMTALLEELLCEPGLDNPGRFRQIVLESKARVENSLVARGAGVVNSRLRARLHPQGWIEEQIGGLDYLFFLRDLSKRVEGNWADVHADLEALRRHLLNRRRMVCNVTLDGESWPSFRQVLASFLADLPQENGAENEWTPGGGEGGEGLAVPSPVNYVGKGADLYRLGYSLHGSVYVILKYLRTTYFWERIRVQGGAYGGSPTFERRTGTFTYLSWRDPNLLATLDAFDQVGEHLRALQISPRELERSVIGASGDLEPYRLPDSSGYASLVRNLVGERYEDRQRIRDEVLSTTPEHFRAFGEVLNQVKDQGQIVVLGARDSLEEANQAAGLFREIRQIL